MNNQTLQQDHQDFLDPDNRETLLKFLRGRNIGISEEMIDIVNRMAPLRVMEKVTQDESLSQEAKRFFRKIEATNNGAKPGENFEDFLWRYIESDDVPAIAEDELEGLAEVYEKVSGIEPQDKAVDVESESQLEKTKHPDKEVKAKEVGGIKLQVKAHPEDIGDDKDLVEDETDMQDVLVADETKDNSTKEQTGEKKKNNLKDAIKQSQVDLVKELGIDKLPKEEQEKALLQMGEIIQQRILLRVVEEFPEDKKDELLKLTEDKEVTPEQFNEFVEKNLPNIEEIVSDEVEKYKKEALDFAGEVLGE